MTRRLAVFGLVAVAGLVLWRVPAGAQSEAKSADTQRRVQRLAQQVDILEKRAELATGDAFYLVIDPENSRLRLMLQGAVLREYAIQGLEVGTPRVAFRPRNLGGGWAGHIWSQGQLVPPRPDDRVEIVPPDSTALSDSTHKVLKIPPLPEEKYPVPHRYHIRYVGGLSLEVRPQQLDSSLTTWKKVATSLQVWSRDVRTATAKQPEDTVRLRLVLRPEDAASLYRAMPPETRLLVLPIIPS